MKNSNKKQTIILIIIAVLIIALVVIIVVGAKKKNQEKTVVTTTTVPSSSATATTVPYGSDLSKDGKMVMDGDHNDVSFVGVTMSTINGEKGLYYFSGGIYDPAFTGLSDGDGGKWYYVKNGKVDTKFSGFVGYNYYYRYIKSGIYQNHFNGKFHLNKDDKEGYYDIKDGALYGLTGCDDGQKLPDSFNTWYVTKS